MDMIYGFIITVLKYVVELKNQIMIFQQYLN